MSREAKKGARAERLREAMSRLARGDTSAVVAQRLVEDYGVNPNTARADVHRARNEIKIEEHLACESGITVSDKDPASLPRHGTTVAAGSSMKDKEPKARIVCLADVTPVTVSWLWEARIPRGMITIIDGDPGLGKSTLASTWPLVSREGAPCRSAMRRRARLLMSFF